MVAPPECDIRQSGRVLELQNRDLKLRPTDMSWHLHILMTIREETLKDNRSRSSEKWKAKEDKIEEAKKQKVKRSDDDWNYADWQPSSWSWQQTNDLDFVFIFILQRGRSDWRPSADWRSSDQTHERSEWRSSGSRQSPFLMAV